MRRLVLVLVAAASLAAPALAAAHPLGNFTVNRFSRIEVAAGHLYVRYVLDLAEIPTLQAGRMDREAQARRIAGGLELRVGARRAALLPVASRLRQPVGDGGLRTTRLEVVLRGPAVARPTRVDYRDTNFRERIGWKEIVVGDARSRSGELRSYPEGVLSGSLDQTSISTTVTPRDGPAPTIVSPPPAARAASGFEGLVHHELSLGFVVLSLGLALFWGAAHALGPGHGKAIVAGYLVGTRGTARHAVLLGLVVTVTHTLGVFALGLVTLGLSAFLLPEDLYPWLELASALLVVGVGAAVLRSRVAEWLYARAHARARRHRHGHHHHQHHHHDHGSGFRSLVGVGVSGGLLPCPTALVVLLAAISLHRVGYGLLLIVAFSLGLATTVTGIGLVAVTAKRLFARARLEGRLVRALPTASAVAVLVVGAVMTARALPRLV